MRYFNKIGSISGLISQFFFFGSVATVLLHSAFVAPLLLTTLWVKPLSRDYLTDRVYAGMEKPL